jgi:hypothetical protein
LVPLTAAEYLAKEFPQEEWRINHLVPTTGFGVILAAEKTGKSLFALQMAFSIAGGIAFLGRSVSRASVLLIEEEGSQRGFQKRLQSQMGALGLLFEPPPAHFLVRAQVRLDDRETLEEIRSLVRQNEIRVVIVGPLSQVAQIEDENKAGEVNALVRTINALATELDIAVVVIHHRRKGTVGHGPPTSISGFFETARGSNALVAAMDVGIGLYRNQEDDHAWMLVLHRDSESFREYLAFDPHQLCFWPSEAPPTPTSNQNASALELLNERGSLTLTDASVGLKVSRNTAQTRLDRLVEAGQATCTVGGRGRREYFAVSQVEMTDGDGASQVLTSQLSTP